MNNKRKVSCICLVIILASLSGATLQNAAAQIVRTRIDKIRNADTVEKLLNSIDKRRFDLFFVDDDLDFSIGIASKDVSCIEFARSIGAKSWTRADFDGNGYTDLLVIGDEYGPSSVVIMNFGENKYAVHEVNGYGCTIPTVKTESSTPSILLSSKLSSQKTSLIYKFSGFVEFNASPAEHTIEAIRFKRYGCLGKCPGFEMNIDGDGNAKFVAVAYNKKKPGTYQTKLDASAFEAIKALLNYADFAKFNDDYSDGGTDQPGAELTVTYDRGKVKTIHDYGLSDGPFGLRTVYRAFSDITENQNWKRLHG